MTTTDPIGLRLPATTHRARSTTPRHRADGPPSATALLKEAPHALHAAFRHVITRYAVKDAQR